MPALARWGVWDASRVSPSREWQHIPTQHYQSTRTGGQCAGRLLCSWGCATTPQLCLQIHHCRLLGFSAAPREYAFGWTCVFWAECHFGYIFLFVLFSFLKRDLKRAVSQPFWVIMIIFDSIFYVLLSSYRCFFIWTYRAKAICSVPPFKVSAKPPEMDLDHVFVCDVTVGCSGNDYSVSQRKHFVFIHWADSRNILVLQNKTQRFCFVQMFSIITTNQGKKKMEKIACKHYMSFLSMKVLKYTCRMHIVYLNPW